MCYALFFFYEKKACQEKIHGTEVVFEDKNFQFFFQKHAHSDRFFLAHLFFRRKKTMRKKVAIVYEHIFN